MDRSDTPPQSDSGNAKPEGPRGQGLLQVAHIAWQRRSLLLFGVGLGLLFGGIYFVAAPPTYQSTTQVLVVKKRPDEVTGKDTRNLAIEDYVATQQTLVGSPLIIEHAIEKRSLSTLPTFAGWEKDYADGGDTLPDVIRKRISVTRNRGGVSGYNNAVLDLSFRGKTPEDCQVVLEGVLASYREFLDETYRVMSDDTVELIVKARDDLTKELQRKESTYQQFRLSSPVLPAKGGEGREVRHEALGSIQIRRATLALVRTEVEAQLAAIDDALKARRSPEVVLAMILEFSGKGDTEDPRKERAAPGQQPNVLLPLLIEEQRLLANYGPNHSDVKAIRRRIEAAREVVIRPTAGVNTAAARADDPAATVDDAIKAHVAHLRQKLDYVQTAERLLTAAYEKEHAEARTLTSYEIKEEHLRTDIARTQSLYDAIIKRLQDVSLVKQGGGYNARIISPPQLGRKIAPKAIIVFPLAIVLGALVGIGLVYLAEITDHRFRSPEEVGKRLSLPVVGYVPHIPRNDKLGKRAAQAKLDPTLDAYHRPRSALAEVYRGVRTALFFSQQGERNQLIQVTSGLKGEGKSTIAANLAISIAQSGKRTLLIDADLRRPTLHKLFNLPSTHGLVSIITNDCKPEEVVVSSAVPNLWVLGCGRPPPNPAEVLTSALFHDLLESFRAEYDFVIVDSPPLLVVTDPSVIAPIVDGVLLVVRMGANARQPAERSREVLKTLGANIVGAVVNDVGESSRPGYGYGYGGYTDEGDEPASAAKAVRRKRKITLQSIGDEPTGQTPPE
ncbi:MAG: polysaccharide biosynthesis tyrosine autokinase [Gemmataceae bacterium]|nr:polysaccharide biosynthesis tyrosine autokinase [Gemmataceae bacterium]